MDLSLLVAIAQAFQIAFAGSGDAGDQQTDFRIPTDRSASRKVRILVDAPSGGMLTELEVKQLG